jgi:hypothetical protein
MEDMIPMISEDTELLKEIESAVGLSLSPSDVYDDDARITGRQRCLAGT